MSLHSILNEVIKFKGEVSLSEVHYLAEEKGYKQSTAERTLRPSESPNVETIFNDKGFVKAYKWIGKEILSSNYDPSYIALLKKQEEERRGGGLI